MLRDLLMLRDLEDHYHPTLSWLAEKDRRPDIASLVHDVEALDDASFQTEAWRQAAMRFGWATPLDDASVAEVRRVLLGDPGSFFPGQIQEFLTALDTLPEGVEREDAYNDYFYVFTYRGRRESGPYLALATLSALGIVWGRMHQPRSFLDLLPPAEYEHACWELAHAAAEGREADQRPLLTRWRARACVLATPQDRASHQLADGLTPIAHLDALDEYQLRSLYREFGAEVLAWAGWSPEGEAVMARVVSRLRSEEAEKITDAAAMIDRRRQKYPHRRDLSAEALLRLRAWMTQKDSA